MLNIQNVEDNIIAIDGPIAIGMDSTIYNYDGKEWKRNFYGNVGDLLAIADNPDAYTYVITGEDGLILFSKDFGKSWHLCTNRTEENLNGVKFCNGQFVAVGDNGVILISTDGENWKNVEISPFINGFFSDVTYFNGKYIITGGKNRVCTSIKDGIYSPLIVITADFHLFKIISEDLQIMGRANNPKSTIHSIIEFKKDDKDCVIMASSNEIYISEDGNNWKFFTSIEDVSEIYKLAYTGNLLLCIALSNKPVSFKTNLHILNESGEAVGFLSGADYSINCAEYHTTLSYLSIIKPAIYLGCDGKIIEM